MAAATGNDSGGLPHRGVIGWQGEERGLGAGGARGQERGEGAAGSGGDRAELGAPAGHGVLGARARALAHEGGARWWPAGRASVDAVVAGVTAFGEAPAVADGSGAAEELGLEAPGGAPWPPGT